MARIAGVDLPRNKRMEIALTYLYGIGRVLSRQILTSADVSLDKRKIHLEHPIRTLGDHEVELRLHADVVQLADGGYSADEILAAFEQSYGEKILMAPHKQGFNWVGWLAPFAAVGGGAFLAGTLIRRWGRRAAERRLAASPVPIEASDDEMARLEAAIRSDDP